MHRLKLGLYLFGVIYFSFFIYFIYTFAPFNLSSLCILINGLFLYLIAVYDIHHQTKQQDIIKHIQVEKDKVQNWYDRSNQSFNLTLNYVTDGIALLNLELDFFKTNKGFCDILGYTSEKILTWNLDDLVSLSHLSKHKIGINQLLIGKLDHYPFKLKMIKKSGDVIWLSVCIVLIRDSHKKPYNFIMYIHRISHHKINETQASDAKINQTSDAEIKQTQEEPT